MSRPRHCPHCRPRKAPKKAHGVQGGSSEANRFAVVILEVLAGGRSPGEAAKVLGVTPPRYYQLETRALEGHGGGLGTAAARQAAFVGESYCPVGKGVERGRVANASGSRPWCGRRSAVWGSRHRRRSIASSRQRRSRPQKTTADSPCPEGRPHAGPGYSTAGGGNVTTGGSIRPSSGRGAGERWRAQGGRSTAFQGTSG